MRKVSSLIMAVLMTATLFIGCTEQGVDFGDSTNTPTNTATGSNTDTKLTGKVTMSGSTSMEDLVNALGSSFKGVNSGVSVEVQSGGSSVGVTNAKDGITDIGNSSRALKEDEKSFGLTEYIIAIDGIAVVVNTGNTITGLTTEQIGKIFTGEITNWKDLGGDDAQIIVIGREAGSGTRDGFEELIKLDGKKISERTKYTIEVNETGLVKTKVKAEKYAIGYMSLGKIDENVKALQVDGVDPSAATVSDKTYPIQRPFVCLTKGSESSLVKAFLDYIFSAEGQSVVEKHGYVKVK